MGGCVRIRHSLRTGEARSSEADGSSTLSTSRRMPRARRDAHHFWANSYTPRARRLIRPRADFLIYLPIGSCVVRADIMEA